MIETLQAGITTVVDCWGVDNGDDAGRVMACASASLDVHVRSGARVIFGRMLAEQVPEPWLAHPGAASVARLGSPASGSLQQVAALAQAFAGDRVVVTPAPELPELMSPTGLQDSLALAAELGAVMPIHLCPSPESRAVYGPDELAAIGVLDSRLLGAHCIAVSSRDVEALSGAGIRVAHCPSANRALRGGGSGPTTTPVAAFRAAGAPVGLGLDNASLNPQADLFAEARQAIWSAAARGDRLEPDDVFAMATLEGARAVGLEAEIGSLAAGKRADLVVLDTSGEHWWPHASWVSAVVWQARPSDVRTVVVDGEVVVADGRCLTLRLDRAALAAASRRLREAVAAG
jgi:5-methylthioadenosine/S-adenosylhomocysteine deaminase